MSLSMIDMLAERDPKEKKYKEPLTDMGVKKCFVILNAPCTENYPNLKALLEKISFYDFKYPFVITADQKLMAIACGNSSASAAFFPCPLCLWPKGSSQKGFEKRSFAYNSREYQQFITKYNRNLKKQSKCYNTVNEPLPVAANPDSLVRDVF